MIRLLFIIVLIQRMDVSGWVISTYALEELAGYYLLQQNSGFGESVVDG